MRHRHDKTGGFVDPTHNRASCATSRHRTARDRPLRPRRALTVLLGLAALLLPALLVVPSAAAQTATPPQIVAMSPSFGATGVDPNTKVVLTFDRALDPASIRVYAQVMMSQTPGFPAGYRVDGSVAYDAASRTVTFTPGVWNTWASFFYGLPPGTTLNVYAGATDTAGNVLPVADRGSFTTRSCPCSVWADSTVPTTASVAPGAPVELGVKFSTAGDGYVTGLRFYKGPGNTGTHVGRLWRSDGQLLASATFTDETATGWQRVDFWPAVPVNQFWTYIASYTAPNGGYAYDRGFFAGRRVVNGVLAAHASGDTGLGFNGANGGGPNGVYGPAGAFPTASYNNANYWVDVVYATRPPPDTTAPRIVGRSPAANAAGVALSAAVSATFSEPIQAGTLAFALRDSAGAAVAGSVAYDAASRTATLTPASRLALGTTYTATISGAADGAGNAMAADSWSFSTPACPCTVWADSTVPGTPSVGAGGPTELGVKFRTEVDGYVTGVRFYKGGGNTGTHVGHLWSASGTPLASATFADETASGWQQVSFSPAVAVTADTTYVASYFAPNSGYAYDGAYLANPKGVTRGPLTALGHGIDGPNGVYRLGVSGFPTSSYNATNYWVDPVFAPTPPPDTAAPKLIARAPANGAADAGLGAAVIATFSEPIQESTLRFVLRDGAGAAVAAAVAYDPATNTATLSIFSPTQLALGATYTAEVTGARDAAGNVMAPDSWSFRVAACPCSLLPDTATPGVTTLAGGGPIELGLELRSTVDGYVTGVRFYKGANNTGTHVGHLWDYITGELLAEATFTAETATGWQRVSFATPVPIKAWRVYTVSYFAPDGGYSYDSSWSGSLTSGPLVYYRAVYRYGSSGQPTNTYFANYWVDAIFTTMP